MIGEQKYYRYFKCFDIVVAYRPLGALSQSSGVRCPHNVEVVEYLCGCPKSNIIDCSNEADLLPLNRL